MLVPTPTPKPAKIATPPSPRPVVWIVDDSPLDGDRARRVLEKHYTVELFADGSAMLEHLASHRAPDVLVLDWVMPGVSGIEVCRFLRTGPNPDPNLAVLLLTMQTQTEQIVLGLESGANDYLVKPYADPELRARVDALVRGKQLLERAQKAEAGVRELLENSPDPLLVAGSQHLITFANAEARDVFAADGASLVGRPLAELLPTLAVGQLSEAARLSRPLPDVQVGDQLFSPSVRILPGTALADLTIALRNVTARRQKESRRIDFYSMIAHDLRSPLMAMLMRTDLILGGSRGVLSADLIADLRKMEAHMRSLVALINDFLDFAKMEEDAHRMERNRFDLSPLIREIVDDFKPLLDNTGQKLRVDDGGEAVFVHGDRRRMQQVLTNLIANAIKFTPAEGAIVVRAANAGRWCEVEVEDSGPGIAPDVLPTLFQRYTRGRGTSDVSGTGLGLMIVREIVEAHGGSVGVESQPGAGSRFWFRLPTFEPPLAGTPSVERPD